MNRPPSNRRPRRGSNRSYYSSNQRDVDPYGQRNSRSLPSNEINFENGHMDRPTLFQKRPGTSDDFLKTGEIVNRVEYKKIFGKFYIKKKVKY